MTNDSTVKDRLEYLRRELRAERISYGELSELQGLKDHIEPGDVELLEAAGVPEFPVDRTEFLGDVITGAVEGGSGYWSQCSQYQYIMDGEVKVCVGKREGDEPRAVLHDIEDDSRGPLIVTPEVVERGIAAILKGGVVNHAMTANVQGASEANDAGMIDSYDCDAIVQAGLFDGEVVYG